jgi:hypothetical protein
MCQITIPICEGGGKEEKGPGRKLDAEDSRNRRRRDKSVVRGAGKHESIRIA